jgi:cytochrome c biogenesis protein CcdA
MVVPFLLPILLVPRTYAAVIDLAQVHGTRLERATGLVLVGMGILLMPVAILAAGV